ncbi:hypothetical protein E3N88_36714 [Mikania micrantha]|uniref:Uncharacterized protein n=1 Tax=Mikania micrantha TaxID=192012 RepID=A0A5N6M4F2_9ASTR|nr:hypothetical protein E3N88_36714 [Mikania micrantha]
MRISGCGTSGPKGIRSSDQRIQLYIPSFFIACHILANFLSIEEWDDEGNDVYWNWAFNSLFPDNQDQEQQIVEQQLGYEEEPEDEYVPNDPWAVDDVDEETINRWRNHDPWEDERSTDSDCSFDSIFND